MLLMFQDVTMYTETIPIFYLALGIPIVVIAIIISISTIFLHIIKLMFKKTDFEKFWSKLEEKSRNSSPLLRDTLRKIPHVFTFVGLFVVWSIGVDFIVNLSGSTSGMIPTENDMASLYIRLISQPGSIKDVMFSLGWFYYLLFFFFYGLNFIMLANEYTRKVNGLAFPFNFICRVFFREGEKESYGAYLYFALGQMFAAFITPPMVFFAILGISSIADLLTSQIGIRFGNHKIRWNREKSWEGTIAGLVGCFIISFFFVGLIWAIIFTLSFLVFDILTNKPLNLSDNLLIPIGTASIYFIIRFLFDLNFYTIFLIWI
jgi:dolichol kinase